MLGDPLDLYTLRMPAPISPQNYTSAMKIESTEIESYKVQYHN